jgi:hypothetical protein
METQDKGISRFAVDLTGVEAQTGKLRIRPVNGVWAFTVTSVRQMTKDDKQFILVGMTLRTTQGQVDYTERFSIPKGLPFFKGMVENLVKPDGKRTDLSKLRPGTPIDWDAALKGCKGVCEISDGADPKYARFSALTADTRTTPLDGSGNGQTEQAAAPTREVTRSEKLNDAPRQERPAPAPAKREEPVIDPADDDIPF